MDERDPLPGGHDACVPGDTYPGAESKSAVLPASILILISGITGVIYSLVSAHPAYGLFMFFQGPQSLIPAGSYPAYLPPMLLVVSLLSAAAGFVLFGTMNTGGRRGKHATAYKLLLILLAATYAEVIIFVIATMMIGIQASQNIPSLSFSGPLQEKLLYAGVMVLLFSFLAFGVAGSFAGTIGTMFNARSLQKRSEYLLMMPFLLAGIYYFPAAIMAGIIGISIPLAGESYLDRFSPAAGNALKKVGAWFLASRRPGVIAASVSAACMAILIYLSSLSVPVYHNGTLIFYTSRYLNGGVFQLPLELGILASSATLMASLVSIVKRRLKLLFLGMMTAFLAFETWSLYIVTRLGSVSDFPERTRIETAGNAFPLIFVGLFLGLFPIVLYAEAKRRDGRDASLSW